MMFVYRKANKRSIYQPIETRHGKSGFRCLADGHQGRGGDLHQDQNVQEDEPTVCR